MMLSGCTGKVTEEPVDDIVGCMDETATNYNPDATVSDRSCNYSEDNGSDSNQTTISVPHTDDCDNTNPHHCLLPFPSSAFLVEDSTTVTGYRLNIEGSAIPDSGSAVSEAFPILNYKDGNSPSSQIFTTFERTPDVSGLASQYGIPQSLDADHGTVLLDMDSGEILPHWIEVSARTQEGEPPLVHIRSIRGLEHNTQYAVAFRDLKDLSGSEINPSVAFESLRDGTITDSPDIENRRGGYEVMFDSLDAVGFERGSLQSAWWFHTASTESITGDLITMRDDASARLGPGGIGCNVSSVDDNYWNDDTAFRRIKGTITTPHYVESIYPPTLMRRASDGTPQFTFNGEVVFTLSIPQSAADSGTPVPLVVLGHGFLGNGEGMVSSFRGWANEHGYATIGTDFKGWSSDGDFDAITFGLMNVNYLQHQAERLQQSIINHLAMIRTIKGVCSDLPEFYNEGANLVDSSGDLNYLGVSLGGIRGPSMLSLIPEIKRGVLFVAGSSFSFIAERSTQYTQFELLFGNDLAYPSTNDRSILLALMQSMWDSTEAETYLAFREGGLNGQLHSYDMLYIVSINDAQVTILSANRAARTSGIPALDNSTYHPYGIEVSQAPIDGSGIVYFDGGFPEVPSGNIQGPMEYHSLAHNQVLGQDSAVTLANEYLLTGIIADTCSGKCDFEGVW